MAIDYDGKRGQIGPSLRGLIYQYERNGAWVTSKWPAPRGKKATKKQQEARQAFKDVMLAMKLTAPNIQTVHRAAASGTPMLPRDTLMAALYGNGPSINFYSGKVIKPMTNKYMASTVLDAIGWEPGSLLWRGADTWEVVPAGLEGQFLQSNGSDKAPEWVQPPAGEPSRIYQMAEFDTMNTRTFCTKGFWFQPIIDLQLTAVLLKSGEPATQALDFRVWRLSATGVILEVLADYPDMIPFVSNPQEIRIPLPLAQLLPAGGFYGVTVSAHGQPGTYATKIAGSTAMAVTAPITRLHGFLALAKEVPVIGDTFERGQGFPYGFSLEFK